jgi:aspartate racemase
MKKLGIIGGAGPFASALLYKEMVAHIYRQRREGIFPEICLLNFPFTRGLTSEESANNGGFIINQLQYCLDTLKSHRAEIAVIACNTMHAFIEDLDLKGIELISLPKTILSLAERHGKKKLLILATQTTQFYGLYEHQAIDMIYPLKEEQKTLDAVIDRILCGEVLRSDSELIAALIGCIHKRQHIDGVVLGCSDLPVLHDSYPLIGLSVPLFDSIKSPIGNIYQSLLVSKES